MKRYIGLFLGSICVINACTHIEVPYGDDGYMVGRSMELGGACYQNNWTLQVSPRGYSFPTHLNPERINGTIISTRFVAKYGIVGIALRDVNMGLPVPRFTGLLDGINEHGLTMAALTHQGAIYQSGRHGRRLQSGALIPYILGRYKTVAQVIRSIKLKRFSVVSPKYVPGSLGIHYSITDKHGESMVLEYENGKPIVHNNTVGILTNDPSFKWHLHNLNQYANVAPVNPSRAGDIGVTTTEIGHVPNPLGHGYNLVGLPGDAGPGARFVRSFFYRAFATFNDGPAKNGQDAVILVTALLNAIMLPKGVVPKVSAYDFNEFTQWNSLKMTNPVKYMFRSYNSMRWESIDLSSLTTFFKTGKALKTVPVFNPDVHISEPVKFQ
uniref:Choloylglycine hydrolase/NAAA C-terminal domain-containing protein n=1 Tax=Mucochytrium quahogii TaxID=96639 RepID=A0A7S2WI14_9STRA|mmetsp:Transcript_4357/g.6472  ORF Transcript_4357/g.6472 Transcript_4357/m.6472 type:complete len:382 (-) Transcript_4357:916-2061(-)